MQSKRSRPTVASKSATTRSALSTLEKSTPEAHRCWVSRHTPRRGSPPAASSTAASSSKVRPMVPPPPAVFSSRTRQGRSRASRASSRAPATSLTQASRPAPRWLPKWSTRPSAAMDPATARLWARRSRDCLAHNLAVAGSIAADGLVLHLGSHLGAGLDACVKEVAGALLDALDALERPCRVLLENTAGGGGTIGRTFDELAAVLEAAGGDPRLGVCLDTQHLWASGVDFSSVDKADRVVADFDATVGLDRLDCIHLNDSKVPFGSQRDRHDNLGQGTIGAGGLAPMLGHPRLQGLPVLLEVAGPEGKGPTRADLATARRIHRVGLRRWAAG